MSEQPKKPRSRKAAVKVKNGEDKLTCGVVMPIAAMEGCSEAHWNDVKTIIYDAIDDAGFTPQLVSDANEVGVIQGRIVTNLFDFPIVVCDVSAKNPNVMFELGMRLAFDKPTVVIKDDKTDYSFDTSPIEHIGYPRDLRHGTIDAFKVKLSDKITATHNETNNPNYVSFLKHFGKRTIATVESKEVSKDEFILSELQELRKAINRRDHSSSVRSTAYSEDEMIQKFIDLAVETHMHNIDKTLQSIGREDIEAIGLKVYKQFPPSCQTTRWLVHTLNCFVSAYKDAGIQLGKRSGLHEPA